jgi:hypothetical protein
MSETTRRIREMSVVVDSPIPVGVTLEEYRSSRERANSSAASRGWTGRLLRRRTQQRRVAV